MSELSDREHATVLENKLLNGDDLGSTASYFFTYLGNRMEFMTAGVRRSNPTLESLLTSALSHYTGEPCNMDSPNFMYMEELFLYHGPVTTPMGYASIFYLERIGMGIMAIAQDDGHVNNLRLGQRPAALNGP